MGGIRNKSTDVTLPRISISFQSVTFIQEVMFMKVVMKGVVGGQCATKWQYVDRSVKSCEVQKAVNELVSESFLETFTKF